MKLQDLRTSYQLFGVNANEGAKLSQKLRPPLTKY